MIYWLFKHPEYNLKTDPSKNAFSKPIFSKNFNFKSLIHSSSESSEEQEKSLKLS